MHKHIADMILSINEYGSYKNPPPSDEKARRAQDDEIFHRARLVNSGYFAKIVLHDYVGGILGLTRDGSAWRLNLTQAMRQGDHEIAPTGEGGAVSCEFNTLYRWHTTTSDPDAQWISQVFQRLVPEKRPEEIQVREFAMAAMKSMNAPEDVREWTFGG
jgi:linoleate 10R-lipoxygenase